MAHYAVANDSVVICNATTGAIIEPREYKGRLYVRLYYNGKAHTHTLAHAYMVIKYGLEFDDCHRLHVHHIDSNKHNDTPANYAMMCDKLHKVLHELGRA